MVKSHTKSLGIWWSKKSKMPRLNHEQFWWISNLRFIDVSSKHFLILLFFYYHETSNSEANSTWVLGKNLKVSELFQITRDWGEFSLWGTNLATLRKSNFIFLGIAKKTTFIRSGRNSYSLFHKNFSRLIISCESIRKY